MREAKTYKDVQELLEAKNAILELREGGTITFAFPDADEPRRELHELPVKYNDDGSVVADLAGVNHTRHTFNVIRQLVCSPMFWRKTTVADQITRFKRARHEDHGILRISKKAGEPLTLYFESPARAKAFFHAVETA